LVDALGIVDGELLGHHAAHREADEGRLIDAVVIEQ